MSALDLVLALESMFSKITSTGNDRRTLDRLAHIDEE